MAKGQPPKFRLKAKRKDGTELPAKDREGNSVRMARAEVGVVWENDGKLTFKFTDAKVQAAVEKVLGGECWFDLFGNDSGGSRSKSGPGDSAEGDSDF